MATLFLLKRLTLLLHILLPTLGYPARVQSRGLFHESAVDSESIAAEGRYKRLSPDLVLACRDPGVPANGSRMGNEFNVGQELVFACESGFVLHGSEVLTCQYNVTNGDEPRWDGELPQCVGGLCSSLGAPANGRVIVNHYHPRGMARYSCNAGYFISGTLQRVCSRRGRWSGQQPTCERVCCANLKAPANGFVRLTNGNKYESVATYSCDYGYELFGVNARFCQSTGIWTGKPPGCYEIECGELPAPRFGSVSFNGTTLYSEAVYSCDPGYVLRFGDQIRTCIARGRWSGREPYCIREKVMCPTLTDPENGRVEFTTNIGDTAIYTCNNNYILSGDGTRLCLPSGMWSGNEPTCNRIQLERPMCGNLSDPENGRVEIDSNFTVADYSCDEGFELVGVTFRTCLRDGKWSDSDPTCVLVDCGGLESPDNGTVDLREGTTFNSTAIYSCDDTFELVGNSTCVCLSSGVWSSEPPICKIIDCGSLIPPTNGQVEVSTTILGSQANYSCNPTFTLVGTETRICMENREWSLDAPTCESLQCPELFDILNGRVMFTSRTPGSIANYTCRFGFELQGDKQRVCLEDETWAGQPPTCSQIRCPVLANPINGTVNIQDITPGAPAVYSCNPPLSLIGTFRRICTTDGTWSGEPPTCRDIQCPILSPPANGQVFVDGQTVDSIATYFCRQDFVPQLLVRTCLDNGQWSGFDPQCIRTVCDGLPNPTNGVVTVNFVALGSVATYACDQDYTLVGQSTRTCVRNGVDTMWSGQAPTCQLIMCPELFLINGNIIMLSNIVDALALHMCDTGFMLMGLLVRQCNTSGQWSGSPPTCRPEAGTISCPILESPSNGNIGLSATSPNATVSYSCTSGYVLEGPMTRTCLANGSWTDFDPLCNPVDCGVLVVPENGRILLQPTPDSTTFRSLAVYFCDEGFRIVGQSLRVCQPNGIWSSTDPTCQLVDCGPLDNPVNGLVDTSAGTTFGSTATYSCNLNFMINGTSTRFCTAEGVWEGQPPVCVPIAGNLDTDCGDPGTPANGTRNIISTILDSVVNYTCTEGFTLVGNATRTCQLNQEWSGELPVCDPVMCPLLPVPNNATLFVNGREVGSMATYICHSGFIPRPGDVIIRNCQANGEWTGTEPQCIPVSSIMCPPLSDPTNGAVTVSEPNIGSVANFSCNLGYVLRGSAILQCGIRGMWNAPEPTCERIQCPDPGVPLNGRRLGNDFRAGMITFFSCNDGFQIQGQQILECLDIGLWSNDTPICVETDTVLGSTTSEGTVIDQFGRICDAFNGQLESCCRYRQDWSTLEDEKKSRYINAVKTVSSDPSYSLHYNELISRYRKSFTTDIQLVNASISQFIPWHRYFLMEYENLLRLVDNDITIPYWDWTVSPNSPFTLPVFDNTLGFGNSANQTTLCVSSGPFQEGQFEVTPSAGGGCLMREYVDSILPPTRALIENNFLSLSARMFEDFHNAIFRFVNLMVRCIVGGDMCSVDAANDPLYLLQLARVDLIVDRWQNMDEERASVRYADDETPLDLTFDDNLLVLNFSSNKNLPYGMCIRYSDLQAIEESTASTESLVTDPVGHSSSTDSKVELPQQTLAPSESSSRDRRKRHQVPQRKRLMNYT